MRLLALGAFWLNARPSNIDPYFDVLMHLLALGAFWLHQHVLHDATLLRLNAPFGARCFLAVRYLGIKPLSSHVLMHLLALGAFWHNFLNATLTVLEHVLMHLLALGAF